jgi:hypothetical protein
MFATARYVIAATLAAAVLGGSSPALAADRVTGTSMPAVDFTLASDGTYVAGVAPSIPPSMLADVLAAPVAPSASLAIPLPAPSQAPSAPSSALSQTASAPFSAPSFRRSMYVSFAALQVMDAVSTSKAIGAGGVEANPAMSGVVQNKTAFMAVKLGTAAGVAFLSEKLAKNHPRKATVMMLVLNVAYAAIVTHNYRVAQSNR